nr:MAG TPA: hypothetical protein [Caudoviricetes sp.]
MSKSEIIYKDIAPGAAEAATAVSDSQTDFSDVASLISGVETPAISTCEQNNWLLNGAFQILQDQPIAFWSTEISNESGTFLNRPVISIMLSKQFSSVGLTIYFDTETGDHCSSINIKWYQQDQLKADVNFFPDSSVYFCEHHVENYDRIVITLIGTGIPYRYAKISRILFGIIRTFDMTELRNVRIINSSNLISAELPISTLNWVLESKENVEFMFQMKQPVEVKNDNTLIGVYYIDKYSRTTENLYKIGCYDAIGVLNESVFPGGVYQDYSARQLLYDIIGDSFSIAFEVSDELLTGILQQSSKRSAMQQVLFALGACVSTDGRDSIRIFSVNDSVSAIDKDRIYVGTETEVSSIVTEVRVSAHAYTEDEFGSIEINGRKYKDTETVYSVSNPNVTANDKENVISVKNATLISNSNGQSTAQRIYDFYMQRRKSKAKIVWHGEILGDCISLPNVWGELAIGNIAKMEITLSNTVAANCETIGL